MLTTVYLLFAIPILGFLFTLLAAIRVGRRTLLGGIAVFFLAPLSTLWALFRYWNEPELKARFPLLGSLFFASAWIAISLYANTHADVITADSARRRASQPHESGEEIQARYNEALKNLPLQTGHVELDNAGARLDVPTHFRFVDRTHVRLLSVKFGGFLDHTTSGWMVHETVNLADDDPWFVELDWHPVGYVDEGTFVTLGSDKLLSRDQENDRLLSQRNGDDPDEHRIVRYAEEPELAPDQHTATWVEEYASTDSDQHRLDCYAVKLMRGGYMQYTISDIAVSRRELCLRTVRLAAARTVPASGKGYADHSSFFDRKAKFDLAAIVTGANLLH